MMKVAYLTGEDDEGNLPDCSGEDDEGGEDDNLPDCMVKMMKVTYLTAW